jgi:hypothetical protein
MIKELLLLAVPLSVALFYLFRAPPLWIFGVSILAVDPPGRGNKESHIAAPGKAGRSGCRRASQCHLWQRAEFILAFFILAAGSSLVVKA